MYSLASSWDFYFVNIIWLIDYTVGWDHAGLHLTLSPCFITVY